MSDPNDVPDADDSSVRKPFVSKTTPVARQRMVMKTAKQQYAEMLRDMQRPTYEAVPDRDDDVPVGTFR